jgi:hypothetical protein
VRNKWDTSAHGNKTSRRGHFYLVVRTIFSATASKLIIGVVLMRSIAQMRGIAARRVIARMQNTEVARIAISGQAVRQAVC